MTCLCGKEVTPEEFYKHIRDDRHRCSPAQWGEAYRRIEAGRERAKVSAKKENAGR
jgi:hypothetical protein